MKSATRQKLLIALWMLGLVLITSVILFAPSDTVTPTQRVVMVTVLLACWLFALLAFTPLRRSVGSWRVLSERASNIVIGALVVAFIALIVLGMVFTGGGGLGGIVVAGLAVYMGVQILRQALRAKKKKRGKPKTRKQTEP